MYRAHRSLSCSLFRISRQPGHHSTIAYIRGTMSQTPDAATVAPPFQERNPADAPAAAAAQTKSAGKWRSLYTFPFVLYAYTHMTCIS
jgi:hypothetical protein